MTNHKSYGTYGNYNLFESVGRYYALPKSIDSNDEIKIALDEGKAIHASGPEDLEKILHESEKWADTRGLYGLEETDKKNILRVNSFNVLDDDEVQINNPKVVVFDGIPFLVDGDEIKAENVKDINKNCFVNAISLGAVPELIFAYKLHNIVEYDKVFFGIRQDFGQLDLTKVNPLTIRGIFVGETVKEVMNLVDGLSKDHQTDKNEQYKQNKSVPELKQDYDEYNIIAYNGVVYGLPKSLGPTDLTKCDPSKLEGAIMDTSIENVINNIILLRDKSEYNLNYPNHTKDEGQKLLETYNEYLIYSFENTFFAYPKDAQYVDFSKDDYFSRNDVIYDVSITGLREAIDN
jgi:hypothetical protein